MSGVSIGSGLYSVYTLRTGAKGALDLAGHRDNFDAIEALARRSLCMIDANEVDAVAAKLREAVEKVIADRKRDDENDARIERAGLRGGR
jgi:hypothetical protein